VPNSSLPIGCLSLPFRLWGNYRLKRCCQPRKYSRDDFSCDDLGRFVLIWDEVIECAAALKDIAAMLSKIMVVP